MIQRTLKPNMPNCKHKIKENHQRIDKRSLLNTHQRTQRKKRDEGYLFKLEQCFYVQKTFQGQKGNKHIIT